jgi:hypothetical protein
MGAVLAGTFAAILVALSSGLRPTMYDNYALLASAFAHGHVWIDQPGDYVDALPYHGRYYVIEGPLPALLLVPFARLGGGAPNQVLLGVVLTGVAAGAAWEICRRLGVNVETSVWLCLFLFAGTDLWWCGVFGDVWFVAHTAAAAFTLLALAELAGKRRGRLVGLWGACAALSRFSLALALPIYAFVLSRDPSARRKLAGFAAALVPFAVFWVAYNELRWNLPYDIGYTAWFHQDPVGAPGGSPFALRYLPGELYSFFVRPPMWLGRYPWAAPSVSGTALEWTSPALALAFLARGPRAAVAVLWALAIVVAAPSLLYYANGASQFGMRHALDFEPFLFVLIALAVRERLSVWASLSIVYSVLAGMWGIWYWRAFLRPE